MRTQRLFIGVLLGIAIGHRPMAYGMPSGGGSSSTQQHDTSGSQDSDSSHPASKPATRSSRPSQPRASTPKPSAPPVQEPSPEAIQDPGADDLFMSGMSASDRGDFELAVQLFGQANAKRPEDPDTLNMLAHSLRKLGKTDEAIATYQQALQLRPQFPEAREYLGEAYLQAAMEQLQILQSYGGEGEEGREELIEALKSAAAGFN